MIIDYDSTSQTRYISISSDIFGEPKTGLLFNSTGAMATYTRQGQQSVTITLATLISANSVYSSGGFIETSTAGLYRFDIPDAALAIGSPYVIIIIRFTGALCTNLSIDLVSGNTLTPLSIADEVLTALVAGRGAGSLGQTLLDLMAAESTLSQSSREAMAVTLLTHNMSGITGEGRKSLINALRLFLNKVLISETTQTVYKEDDVTEAYSLTIATSSSTNVITGVTPIV